MLICPDSDPAILRLAVSREGRPARDSQAPVPLAVGRHANANLYSGGWIRMYVPDGVSVERPVAALMDMTLRYLARSESAANHLPNSNPMRIAAANEAQSRFSRTSDQPINRP